jgi:hypothetical protein
MAVNLEPQGLITNETIRMQSGGIRYAGVRTCLGWAGGEIGQYIYHHIKLTLPSNTNTMCKFEYDGFTYDGLNVHNSYTFYTYEGTSSPYNPSLVSWGEAGGGIIHAYYSTDNKVVIVVQTHSNYTGGFLYYQAGRSHWIADVGILAEATAASTTGVF